ncbi:hypothetical protein IL306_001900 [Fusarium sp. DS 682]|nr:hypothetical protein IL306_001900 [Fusarium sp. DS 682]
MSLYIDKNGATVVSHELRDPYCGCDSPETIYQALRDMESIEVLRKRQYQKANYRTGKIEAVMREARGRPNAKELMDLYGTNQFRSVVKRLWMRGRLRSGSTAQDDLDCFTPAPGAEEQSMSEKPAEDTPEKSEWEFLIPADTPEEAPPQTLEEETTAKEAPTEEAPVMLKLCAVKSGLN